MSSHTIRIAPHGATSISVTSPYHDGFVSRARALGGRWDRDSKTWLFDEAAEDAVRQALKDAYGTDGAAADEGAEPVALYLYAPETVAEFHGPVSVASITLARAFGRDSGARLGGGTAHLAGPAPSSGGSVKNWRTQIPAGCLLAAYNVPRVLAERALADDRFVAEIGIGAESTSEVLTRLATVTTEEV